MPADLRINHHRKHRPGPTLQEARDAAEKQTIGAALMRNRHNVSRTAKELGVSRMTLYRLLSRHDMERSG